MNTSILDSRTVDQTTGEVSGLTARYGYDSLVLASSTGRSDLQNLETLLTDVQPRYNSQTGSAGIMGKIGNLTVIATPNQVHVKGSIATYTNSHNGFLHTHETIAGGIYEMSSALGIDFLSGDVYRADLTGMYSMEDSPHQYFASLEGRFPYNRYQQGNSVYFNTKSHQKTINVYDKGKDLQAKGIDPVSVGLTENELRIEVRAEKRLKTQVKLPSTFTAKDLSHPLAFRTFLKWWKHNVDLVLPREETRAVRTDYRDVKSFRECCVDAMMQIPGMRERYLADLRAKQQNKSISRQNAARIRDEINQVPIEGRDRFREELLTKVNGLYREVIEALPKGKLWE